MSSSSAPPATSRSTRPRSPACAVSSATSRRVRLALVGEEGPAVVGSSDGHTWSLSETDIRLAARALDRRPDPVRGAAPTGPERPAARRRSHRSDRSALDPSEVRGLLVVCSAREVSGRRGDARSRRWASRSRSPSRARRSPSDLHRRQSEARFRSLVAHSSDLITVLDANGVVTYQSPSIERVLGYRADEVEGTRFDWLLSEADRSRLRQLIAGDGGGSTDAHTLRVLARPSRRHVACASRCSTPTCCTTSTSAASC